jgi:hypothetical protein
MHAWVFGQVGIRRKHHIQMIVDLLRHGLQAPTALARHRGLHRSTPQETVAIGGLQPALHNDRTLEPEIKPLKGRITGQQGPSRLHTTSPELAQIHTQHSPQT